ATAAPGAGTASGPEELWQTLVRERAPLAALLLLFSAATVFGNGLVIVAVARERYLHTATNYFVTSLAVADCLVGLVVMPFSAAYEVANHAWFFGIDWCDAWRSLDVLASTASILNLCVISLDRYWAITDPFSYPARMTGRRAAALITAVWVCSGAISFPAIAWWRAVRPEHVPPYKCPFTENLSYLVFSSTISFYLPLFVMVFTYYRIYRAAVVQTRSLKLGTKQVLMASGELELTLRIHRGGHNHSGGSGSELTSDDADQQHPHQHGQAPASAPAPIASSPPPPPLPPPPPQSQPLSRQPSKALNSKNFSLSRKLAKFAKEKKAAKTLGIVMGVFIVCWLPFFIVNPLSVVLPQQELFSAVVCWLGWLNSGMNPVIYACWSRDFRRAFVRILCVCCPRRMRRKYQPALRSKPSQFLGNTAVMLAHSSVGYSSVGRHQHQLYRI
ncbi:dopamine receptor 2, partial [Schistocerca nitens]|uniref:dopamine receptor 2 n=2 Tax=Schistocerca TaxID=7008 RepID=UPI002118D62F